MRSRILRLKIIEFDRLFIKSCHTMQDSAISRAKGNSKFGGFSPGLKSHPVSYKGKLRNEESHDSDASGEGSYASALSGDFVSLPCSSNFSEKDD